ncbi:MAG TPA: DEAD/DEAH box helicase [Acidimicrobiia bacterium]|nr:DEAD/DEAH box helicase [Acidimicrobiia bacterium]
MSTTFGALGIAPDLVDALERGGITSPFPIQALTIPDALARRDVCGKARTGSGKTLAFGLPLLHAISRGTPNKPAALVLVPTRELAVQVHKVLDPLAEVRGISMVLCYGGTPFEKQIKALRRGVDIVVATPGRLIDLVNQGVAELDGIKTLVIDEADRMNDMGFRPQVEWLLRQCTADHQTLLFSATLDGQVDSLVQRFLKDPVRHDVEEEATIETMTHRFISVHELDKPKLTATIARSHGRTLVFVRTKRAADRLASALRDERVTVAAIHGDRTQPARERALARFAEGKINLLVATDVAARGLHIEGIDTVIHYDMPEDHKAYLHRSGRTARAGEAGLVVTLVAWNEGLAAQRIQKKLELDLPIVEMLSNDPRLSDLVKWDPNEEAAA